MYELRSLKVCPAMGKIEAFLLLVERGCDVNS